VVTEGGFAKRTSVDQYRLQNRGGIGIKVAKLEEKRGDLVGAIIAGDDDEVLVVLASGKVVRSAVNEVPARGRDTMGVVFARFDGEDSVIGFARNTERHLETQGEVAESSEEENEQSAEATAEESNIVTAADEVVEVNDIEPDQE
jgi:DNA gyrase subunit A